MIDKFAGKEGTGFYAVYDGHGGRGVVEFVAHRLNEVIFVNKKHFYFFNFFDFLNFCQ